MATKLPKKKLHNERLKTPHILGHKVILNAWLQKAVQLGTRSTSRTQDSLQNYP